MSNTLDEKYTLSTLASVAQGLLGHDIYYAPSWGVGVAFPAGASHCAADIWKQRLKYCRNIIPPSD